MAKTNRAFFSKKITRIISSKLPSTAEILIQTDDSPNMGDFVNWATDSSVLLNLNSALESEKVGSSTLGTQYFNRFGTSTLRTANTIPTRDWIGRNIAASSSIGSVSRTWIRKDFIDQYKVKVIGVNEVPPTGIASVSFSNPPVFVLKDGNTQVEYTATHATPASGSGATFGIFLREVLDADGLETGEYTVETVSVVTSGSGYTTANLTIKGSQIGGDDGIDDLTLSNVRLNGFNITIPKSSFDLGINIDDFVVGSLSQIATVSEIRQNETFSQYYDIFFNIDISSFILVGDEVNFERGVNSIWSRLNTIQNTSNRIFSLRVDTRVYHSDLLPLTQTNNNVTYPLYFKNIRIRTTENLSTLIPTAFLGSEQWSVYLQVWRNNSLFWDSLIISNYSLLRTAVENDITYYEYNITFKYSSRYEITSSDIVQNCIIYKNTLNQISKNNILTILPSTAFYVRFSSDRIPGTNITFPATKVTTDDVDSSINYPQEYTPTTELGFNSVSNTTFYLWSSKDITDQNYPPSNNFSLSGFTTSLFSRSYTPTSNFQERFFYFTFSHSFSGDSATAIKEKNRIKINLTGYNGDFSTLGVFVNTASDGSGTVIIYGVYDQRASTGHDGDTTLTPWSVVSPYPINESTNSPRLISNVSTTSQTTGIQLSNLIQPVQSITYRTRIGGSTEIPQLSDPITKYWKKEFPSDDNLGTTFSKYIKINNEIIKYTGYTEVGDNTYELTGVVRAQLGTTASTHTASVASSIPARYTISLRESSTILNTDGTINITTGGTKQFFWTTPSIDFTSEDYLNSGFYSISGKAKSDDANRSNYELPLYGPGNFTTISYNITKTVTAVQEVNNRIFLNSTAGLAPKMIVTGLTGLINGNGNNATISKVNHYNKSIELTSTGTIFDSSVSSMIGNTATFRFNTTQDGQCSVLSLTDVKHRNFKSVFYVDYQTGSNRLTYYLEPYSMGTRSYEDLYGAGYQSLINSRNQEIEILEDNQPYYTPRSSSDTFLIQASRDQFYSLQSLPSEKIKIVSVISSGDSITLNDSYGIEVGDTIYGPHLPSQGAIISSIQQSGSNAIIKVRKRRITYSNLQIQDYTLGTLNGQSVARIKILASQLNNQTLVENISFISKLNNTSTDPSYGTNQLTLFSGGEYTAPIINVSVDPQDSNLIIITSNNASLINQSNFNKYKPYPSSTSTLQIVVSEKIENLPSIPVNTKYTINPRPGLNKPTTDVLDTGKVTWFFSKWNVGDNELDMYYAPDIYDPSIFWNIDTTEECKYFSVDSSNSITYTADQTSGTSIRQLTTFDTGIYPAFNFIVNDAIYFTNIPTALSSIINVDTVYYITSVNATLKTITVSTTEGGTAIDFGATVSNIKLKIRKAYPLFKTAVGTTSGSTLTFSTSQSNINVGGRVYGPGITGFRSITARTPATGNATSVTLDSDVDTNTVGGTFKITGVNSIRTKNTFNNLIEILTSNTIPTASNVIIGSTTYSYTNAVLSGNSFTFTVPATQLNDLYLKPLTKIGFKYPKLTLAENIDSTSTIIRATTNIPASYPDFGNIKIDNEIIYYGYKRNNYFGECVVKSAHNQNAEISFNPYYAVKENSIIHNGSDYLANVKVNVIGTYPVNASTVDIKVSGLEVDPPNIANSLAILNSRSLQTNENIGISDKIDITKKITYVNNQTLRLPANTILSELKPGDEILLQTSYGLGSGYKISLLKNSTSFILNKPTENSSVFNESTQTSPFRKMFVVDSQSLASLNDKFIREASVFNGGKTLKYIPLSGCLSINPAKCTVAKYFVEDTVKNSTAIRICDNSYQPTILTGLTTKYSSGSTKNTGNYILSFEGNDYEIKSISGNLVTLTTPLKIDAKIKDSITVKSQLYTPSYERVGNVKGLIYGPQKAILFDDLKSVIVGSYGTITYEGSINKTIDGTNYSQQGEFNSFIKVTNVNSLHETNVFVTGTGIASNTKVKSIDYKNRIVYLTKPLAGIPSGNIAFSIRKFKIPVTLSVGTTTDFTIGDTVSFVISSSTSGIDITRSSYRYYISSITNSTQLTINGDFNAAPTSNIMYVSSKDGFIARDFEIASIDLGGFKDEERQQVVNTSIIADGTNGAIFDIEAVQTRATREKFTNSLGKTLGRFIFKQRTFTSKNKPVFWREVSTAPSFVSGQRVTKIISTLYNNAPAFFAYSGSKIYWTFDLQNWNTKDLIKTITSISTTSSNNLLVSYNNKTFVSLPIATISSSSGQSYTLSDATSIKFIKRVNNYTFIQRHDGNLYYTSTDPSSATNSSITWYLITLNNTNNVIDIIFDDFNYVVIFDKLSTTNFYKNYTLGNMTEANLNIATASDKIKGYSNIFRPAKTNSVTYGLGKFLEAGYKTIIDENTNSYANPFIEVYEYENFGDVTSSGSPEQYDVKSVSFADGQFVAVGTNTGTSPSSQFIRYSPNGKNWYDATIEDNLISSDEEIVSICYGGFNRYVASLWNSSTSTSRFIISSVPNQSTTNLTSTDTNLQTGKFRIIEPSGNTALYRYKTTLLDGNLLAWDETNLTYFSYDSGSPVESNELNDHKIIACQKCSYYNNNGLIVPNFRTQSETIEGNTVTTPISLYSEGLTNPIISSSGSGYVINKTFTNVHVESVFGFDARVTVTTNASGQVSSVIVTDPGKFYSNLSELQTGLILKQGTGNDGSGNTFTGTTNAVVQFTTILQIRNYSVYGAENNQTGYALLYKNLLNSSLYYVMFFNNEGKFIDSKINIPFSDISHLTSASAFSQGL